MNPFPEGQRSPTRGCRSNGNVPGQSNQILLQHRPPTMTDRDIVLQWLGRDMKRELPERFEDTVYKQEKIVCEFDDDDEQDPFFTTVAAPVGTVKEAPHHSDSDDSSLFSFIGFQPKKKKMQKSRGSVAPSPPSPPSPPSHPKERPRRKAAIIAREKIAAIACPVGRPLQRRGKANQTKTSNIIPTRLSRNPVFSRQIVKLRMPGLEKLRKIRHRFVTTRHKKKSVSVITNLIDSAPDTRYIVFCNSDTSARQVCANLCSKNIFAKFLSIDDDQETRKYIFDNFQEGLYDFRIIIGTDFIFNNNMRCDASMVINYELPLNSISYRKRASYASQSDPDDTHQIPLVYSLVDDDDELEQLNALASEMRITLEDFS